MPTADFRRPTPGQTIPVSSAEHGGWLESIPGYAAHQRRKVEFATKGIDHPYFRAHDGISGATVSIGGREYVNFSGYDYLGLAGHPEVMAAAQAAIDRYGTSVSASRIVSGEIPLHRELEQALATALGCEDAVTFVSGHGANVSTIGHLMGPADLILMDQQSHNSIQIGARLSGAKARLFRHNDLDRLERILGEAGSRFERTMIVVEGAYSMDGDIVDLPRLVEIKRRHGAILMVDEAHSFGVLGARGLGVADHFGIPASEVDIWMGSLSKSMASCGGFIAGCAGLVEYLKFTAPGFVFSVGLPPAEAGAALAALGLMLRDPGRVATLQARARLFLDLARAAGLAVGPCGGTPVIPVLIGDPDRCLRLAAGLFEQGFNVFPILPPAVTNANARLRFFITASHTEAQIRAAIEATARLIAEEG